jgi:hypothetical protein
VRAVGAIFVPKPTGPLTFYAYFDVHDSAVVPTFEWRVSAGTIVDGQGTATIAVRVPDGFSGEVVASVEARGYPLECAPGARASAATTVVGTSRMRSHAWQTTGCENDSAVLDDAAIMLQTDPSLQAYVVVYAGRSSPKNMALRRADHLRRYLVDEKGVEPGRVIAVDGGVRNELFAEIWLSERDAGPPPTRSTVDPKYVRPVGSVAPTGEPCEY